MLVQDYQNKKQKRQQLQSGGMPPGGGIQSTGIQAGPMPGINSAPGKSSCHLIPLSILISIPIPFGLDCIVAFDWMQLDLIGFS